MVNLNRKQFNKKKNIGLTYTATQNFLKNKNISYKSLFNQLRERDWERYRDREINWIHLIQKNLHTLPIDTNVNVKSNWNVLNNNPFKKQASKQTNK